MHSSLVTSSLIRRNHRYPNLKIARLQIRSGGKNLTLFLPPTAYFGRLIFQYASFNNSRWLGTFSLAAWPVVCIWFVALGIKHHGLQPERV